jgi:hypothetical protein
MHKTRSVNWFDSFLLGCFRVCSMLCLPRRDRSVGTSRNVVLRPIQIMELKPPKIVPGYITGDDRGGGANRKLPTR